MYEQPNQPLTRGQRALAAAIRASQAASTTAQTLNDKERKRCIVSEAMSDLQAIPGITFIASIEDESELGHNLPTLIDLGYRLHNGIDVASGELVHASYRDIRAHLPERHATELVQRVITRFNDNFITFFLAWHVPGSTKVHMDFARMSIDEAFDGMMDLLVHDVELSLGR